MATPTSASTRRNRCRWWSTTSFRKNPILKGFPAFDLDRIEVLRGPQGTLFGRNTPAGVVKFESVRPKKNFEGYGSISVGTFRTINAEGAVNVPTSADSALGLSLLSQTRNDWVNNTNPAGLTQEFEGYRDTAFRAQWQVQAGQDLSALVNLHARDYDGSARLFRANIIQPGTNDFVAGFDERRISTDGKNEQTLKNVGASLRLRLGLEGGLTLHSITGYETVDAFSRGDIDGASAPYVFAGGPGSIPFLSETADGMPKHRQLTQELRVESNQPGPLNWQAGVYLFHEDYKVESFNYNTTAASVQDGYERIRQKNDAYALFGAVNYTVSPAIKLRGGLRYTHDKKRLDVEDYNTTAFVPCNLAGKCTLAQLAAQEPDGNPPRVRIVVAPIEPTTRGRR